MGVEKMKFVFFLLIAQAFAQMGELADGDTGGSEPVYAKNEMPAFDWQPMEEPKVEKLEALVEDEAVFYSEYKVDDADLEEEETSELVEVEGKLAEDDSGNHTELYDDEDTIYNYDELDELNESSDSEAEEVADPEPNVKVPPPHKLIEEDVEDIPKPSVACEKGECGGPPGAP